MTLKPCPFCGELPYVQPENPKIEGDAWTRIACDCDASPEVVVRADDTHYEDAKRIWNARPTDRETP